jgi:hypothetical protein
MRARYLGLFSRPTVCAIQSSGAKLNFPSRGRVIGAAEAPTGVDLTHFRGPEAAIARLT